MDLIIHHGASSRFNLDHWKALPALLHVSVCCWNCCGEKYWSTSQIIHRKYQCYFYYIYKKKVHSNMEGGIICQKTISIQKIKLLGEVSLYDLYYSITYSLKWKLFELETCTDSHYLVLNFYQINREDKIRTRNCLVIKALMLCQKNYLNPITKIIRWGPKIWFILFSNNIILRHSEIKILELRFYRKKNLINLEAKIIKGELGVKKIMYVVLNIPYN